MSSKNDLPALPPGAVNYENAPGGPPDPVADFCHEAGIPLELEMSFRTTLSYLDRRRFNMPYADGQSLSVERPFGVPLRCQAAREDLTYEDLHYLDEYLGFNAGDLELLDRLGPSGVIVAEAGAHAGTQRTIKTAGLPTRTEPVAGTFVLRDMFRAILPFYYAVASAEETEASACGTLDEIAIFVSEALALVGWDFTADQIVSRFEGLKFPRATSPAGKL